MEQHEHLHLYLFILQPINRRIVYRIVFFCSHQLEYHESQHPITKHSSGSVYVYAE